MPFKIFNLTNAQVYRIHNSIRLKLVTRLRVGLSQPNEHRFNHNFQSCISPLFSCSLEIESTTFFTALLSFLKYSFNSVKQYKFG